MCGSIHPVVPKNTTQARHALASNGYTLTSGDCRTGKDQLPEMKPTCLPLILLIYVAPLVAAHGLQHHLNGARDGRYTDPLITRDSAPFIHRDLTFYAPLPGPTYAQPLYVSNGPGGRPALIVATEQNI